MIIERSMALGDYLLSNISYYYGLPLFLTFTCVRLLSSRTQPTFLYNYQSSTNKIILNKILKLGHIH